MEVKQGHVYLDDVHDIWYVEKAPTKDSVGIITYVGRDLDSELPPTDAVVKLHVSYTGTILATNGRLVKMINKQDNVIQLFANRKRTTDASDGESSIEALFKQAMERNKENRERLESERSRTNKTTMRTYQIKPKKD